jgi:hypothetical protein
MRPFEILDMTDLMTALAGYTSRYTRMLAEGGKKKDIFNCKETIESLIQEIHFRKERGTSRDPAGHDDR